MSLLAELGAAVPAPGLAVPEPDLRRLDAVLEPWVARVAGQLGACWLDSTGGLAMPAAQAV